MFVLLVVHIYSGCLLIQTHGHNSNRYLMRQPRSALVAIPNFLLSIGGYVFHHLVIGLVKFVKHVK